MKAGATKSLWLASSTPAIEAIAPAMAQAAELEGEGPKASARARRGFWRIA